MANAIYDGTDAVMLSGETTVGDFPTEAVASMDRIVRAAEAELAKAGWHAIHMSIEQEGRAFSGERRDEVA